MKLLNNTVKFETETGIVEIFTLDNGNYGFEWISGYNNGLHNAEPLSTFDAAYREVRRSNSNGIKERKIEESL